MRGLLAVLLLAWPHAIRTWLSPPLRPNIEVHGARCFGIGSRTACRRALAALDSRFGPFSYRESRASRGPFWLKLHRSDSSMPADVPALIVHKGRHLQYPALRHPRRPKRSLARATELPAFSGMQDAVFLLPAADARQSLYARVEPVGPWRRGTALLAVDAGPDTGERRGAYANDRPHLRRTLGNGARRIAHLVRALETSCSSLYAALFSLQALYIAYLSGQGFEWPLLSYALPLRSLRLECAGGAEWRSRLPVRTGYRGSASVSRRAFTPSSAGWRSRSLRSRSRIFAELIGLGRFVAAIGNLIFVGSAVFTLVVAFIAWRRGSRAAGWFLIAWGLLEAFTIATAVRLLFTEPEGAEALLYYGLPLSMVAPPFSSRWASPTAARAASRADGRRAARTDRPAHRCAQPPLDRRTSRRGVLARPRARAADRAAVHRSRPLQGDQRYLRPCRR